MFSRETFFYKRNNKLLFLPLKRSLCWTLVWFLFMKQWIIKIKLEACSVLMTSKIVWGFYRVCAWFWFSWKLSQNYCFFFSKKLCGSQEVICLSHRFRRIHCCLFNLNLPPCLDLVGKKMHKGNKVSCNFVNIRRYLKRIHMHYSNFQVFNSFLHCSGPLINDVLVFLPAFVLCLCSK